MHDASAFVDEDHQHEQRYVSVGTTKKSAAITCPRSFARNVRQVCNGGVDYRSPADVMKGA
jgi:hypothetical protein